MREELEFRIAMETASLIIVALEKTGIQGPHRKNLETKLYNILVKNYFRGTSPTKEGSNNITLDFTNPPGSDSELTPFDIIK